MTPVHFRWSRSSLKLCIAMMSFLFVLGLPMLLSEDAATRLAGAVWIAAFVWLASALVRRMKSTDPVVTVDALGLYDRRIAGEGFGWDEILHIEAYEAESMTWVGIELKDPRVSLVKTRWFVRLFAPLQRLFRFPRVSISMALLDGSPEELIAAIRAACPGLSVSG
jgi:hypothetical protein